MADPKRSGSGAPGGKRVGAGGGGGGGGGKKGGGSPLGNVERRGVTGGSSKSGKGRKK